jgi:uncharacterized protein YecT (DUF1311 family)
VHHLRLGAKGGEINVLDRENGKLPGLSIGPSLRTSVIGIVALGAGLLQFATPAVAAESDEARGSPLTYCWKKASARIELAPCLKKLLAGAENLLNTTQSNVEREAAELDAVTGYRSKNVARTRTSDERWRAYLDAECDRQAEAMSPGTGSGDVYLSCRITLINDRVRQLGMP